MNLNEKNIYFFHVMIIKRLRRFKVQTLPDETKFWSQSLILTGVSDILKTEFPKTNKKV